MQHNWISVLFSMTVLLMACSEASRSPERHDQPGFRIRSDFAVPLNSSDGWAGGLNENVTVEADQPFRIRFEWENPKGLASSKQFHLQYRRNGGNWTGVEAHDFPYPTREMTMDFSVLESGSRPDGWRVVNDAASEIVVSTENDERFLRAQANENPSTILYNPPWLVTEVVTRFRLHSENRQGIAFILDYTDHLNYSQVQLDPMSGIIRVSEVLDGNEIIRTESDAVIPAGEWLDIEIDFEGRDVKVNFQNDLIEFEAQLENEIVLSPLGFEIAPNHGSDFQYFALSGEAQSPRVSIVTSTTFQHGTATTDLLDRSDKPFQAGAGISGSNVTPEWSGSNIHGEFEWPVVIRRFADGAVTNNEGDTFEFRMIDSSSTEPAAAAKPLLTLSIPPAHVGGTFVESPGRIGPWQASNGDLYFIMEPTETDNVFMMIKSTDDGVTWHEVDAAHRPETNDLESVDSRLVGNTIHIIHQVTSSTVYHAFNTSDHPTNPDTWAIRDELAGSVEAIAQTASMEVRSDGSVAAFYLGQEKIHYSVRSPDGIWSQLGTIDPDQPPNHAGPQAVLGADDVIHLAYYGTDGTIWYRRFSSDAMFTPRQLLATSAGSSRAEFGAILPLIFNPERNECVIVYRLASGNLWERRIIDNAPPTEAVAVTDMKVVTDAVDSQQAGADAIFNGDTVMVFFIDEISRSIFSTYDKGGWQPAERQVGGILGSWVRGSVYSRKDGRKVYGYIYDAGSYGGAGMNRYDELVLEK